MKLLIYIPAFNEEENILRTINNLPHQVPGIDAVEVLVVDDGSTDRTAELPVRQAWRWSRFLIIRAWEPPSTPPCSKPWRTGPISWWASTPTGSSTRPRSPLLLQPILENRADAVIGGRFSKGKPQHMPGLKFTGNKLVAGLVSSISGQKFQDVSCGFRAYNREALLHLNLFARFTYTHETILSLVYQGLRVVELPISIRYYPERTSRVASSILHYAMQTSKIILRVMLDYQPMRIFGTVGGVLLAIGTAFELFLLGHYFIIGGFSPYKSFGFIGLGFFIFGMLVLIIALVADMLNRLRINQDKLLYEFKKNRYGK